MKVSKTKEFDKWLRGVKNSKAKAAILFRILRIQERGLLGDHKRIGGDLYELRIHLSPGYRVYFTANGKKLILLLVGGIKRTQKKDIERAYRLLNRLKDARNNNL